MKNLNNYITEKLRINKNTHTELSVADDVNVLFSLLEKIISTNIKRKDILMKWFNDNDIEYFNLYINESAPKIYDLKREIEGNKNFKNLNLHEVSSQNYETICKSIVGDNPKEIDDFKIYDYSDYIKNSNNNEKEELMIWGNSKTHGLIIQTFDYEFALLKLNLK